MTVRHCTVSHWVSFTWWGTIWFLTCSSSWAWATRCDSGSLMPCSRLASSAQRVWPPRLPCQWGTCGCGEDQVLHHCLRCVCAWWTQQWVCTEQNGTPAALKEGICYEPAGAHWEENCNKTNPPTFFPIFSNHFDYHKSFLCNHVTCSHMIPASSQSSRPASASTPLWHNHLLNCSHSMTHSHP